MTPCNKIRQDRIRGVMMINKCPYDMLELTRQYGNYVCPNNHIISVYRLACFMNDEEPVSCLEGFK